MREADILLFIRNPKAGIQGSNEDLADCPSYTSFPETGILSGEVENLPNEDGIIAGKDV
jgi:hypothetical protein